MRYDALPGRLCDCDRDQGKGAPAARIVTKGFEDGLDAPAARFVTKGFEDGLDARPPEAIALPTISRPTKNKEEQYRRA